MNSPNAAITEFEARTGANWLNIGEACALSCKTRSELAESRIEVELERVREAFPVQALVNPQVAAGGDRVNDWLLYQAT